MIIPISSIDDLIDKILENSDEEKELYFRGQKRGGAEGWNLLPSKLRKGCSQNAKQEFEDMQKIWEKTADDVETKNISILEKLIQLQHYEYATRLLDISSNLLTALAFAVNNCSADDSPVLYMIQTSAENVKSTLSANAIIEEFYNKGVYEEKLFVVNSIINNERIKAQSGDFIFFLDNSDLLSDDRFSVIEFKLENPSLFESLCHLCLASDEFLYPSRENAIKGIQNFASKLKELGNNVTRPIVNKVNNQALHENKVEIKKINPKLVKTTPFSSIKIEK